MPARKPAPRHATTKTRKPSKTKTSDRQGDAPALDAARRALAQSPWNKPAGIVDSDPIDTFSLDEVASRPGWSRERLARCIRDRDLWPVVWFELSAMLKHLRVRGRGYPGVLCGAYYLLKPTPWEVYAHPRTVVEVAPICLDGPAPWRAELVLADPIGRDALRIVKVQVERIEAQRPEDYGPRGAKLRTRPAAREMAMRSVEARKNAREQLKPHVLALWMEQWTAEPDSTKSAVDADTAFEWDRRAARWEEADETCPVKRVTATQVARWRRSDAKKS